jgi:hypothetical protein
MDYRVEEIQPDVWRVEIAGTIRIIRRLPESRTFMPWDILSGEGHRLWAAPSLDSAFRWVQARTGLPTEALLAEGLLGQTAFRAALTHTISEGLADSGDSRPDAEALSGSPGRAGGRRHGFRD